MLNHRKGFLEEYHEDECRKYYLAAAACRNNVLLAAQFLEEGHDLKSYFKVCESESGSWVLKPSPIWLAAFYGSNDMLELFLEGLHGTSSELLADAAIPGGHLSTLNMIINSLYLSMPASGLLLNYAPQHLLQRTFTLCRANHYTTMPVLESAFLT
jgi:hypothetical protein